MSNYYVKLLGLVKISMVAFIQIFMYIIRDLLVHKALYLTI